MIHAAGDRQPPSAIDSLLRRWTPIIRRELRGTARTFHPINGETPRESEPHRAFVLNKQPRAHTPTSFFHYEIK